MLSYIAEHSGDITLTQVAEHFNYHPNSISMFVKRKTGKTFFQLRQQLRLSRAAQLLTQGSLSAENAARACGYSNMNNFYTQFYRQYGMKPGEYARKMKQTARLSEEM